MMSGTRAGGLKAAKTNLAKYGKDFYRNMGKLGGTMGKADGVIKGFAGMSKEKLHAVSAKGGRISKRGPAVKLEDYPPSLRERVKNGE